MNRCKRRRLSRLACGIQRGIWRRSVSILSSWFLLPASRIQTDCWVVRLERGFFMLLTTVGSAQVTFGPVPFWLRSSPRWLVCSTLWLLIISTSCIRHRCCPSTRAVRFFHSSSRFSNRICERRRMIDVAGLGAAYALLVLTNLPLAVIGSLSALVFSLVRAAGKGALQIDLRLAAGVLLGLAASAFFWVRMVSELPLIKGSSVDPRPL